MLIYDGYMIETKLLKCAILAVLFFERYLCGNEEGQARTQMRFTSNQDVDQVKASVLAIRHRKGGARIARGLKTCRVELFSVKNGMRSNVPRALLTITDGRISNGKILD